MKGNILKPSMYVLFSIAVVVLFILLFRQCSGDVSTRENSIGSSSPKTSVKKDLVEKGKNNDLNKKMPVFKNDITRAWSSKGVTDVEITQENTVRFFTSLIDTYALIENPGEGRWPFPCCPGPANRASNLQPLLIKEGSTSLQILAEITAR